MNRDRLILRNRLAARANLAARIGLAIVIALSFWTWLFGDDRGFPHRWRTPNTTRVPGGRDT